jgi:hypothetical protein
MIRKEGRSSFFTNKETKLMDESCQMKRTTPESSVDFLISPANRC